MLYKKAGFLTLGSRLKRLGERSLSEVRSVYKQAEVDFETSWFPVFYVLQEQGICSMQELSEQLEVSHSAISQLITQLEKRDLITITVSEADQRRKDILLTPAGHALMEQVLPIWRAFEVSFREHLGADVLYKLDSIEESLDSGRISSTVLSVLRGDNEVEIVETENESEGLARFIQDNGLVSRPECRYLILKWSDRITGVLCFLPASGGIEMDSFFITPSFRRRGLGTQMLAHVIGAYGLQPLIMRQTSPDLLHLLHKTGYSFTVDTLNNIQDGI